MGIDFSDPGMYAAAAAGLGSLLVFVLWLRTGGRSRPRTKQGESRRAVAERGGHK